MSYTNLALRWNPEPKNNKQFLIISVTIVICMMLLGLAISWVKVPEQSRQARVDVPERIANFILNKEKPNPKPVVKARPLPKPIPKPKKKEKPKVTKKIKKEPVKALTKTQIKARDKAAKSGLLALSSELADLMDTSDISDMVGGNLSASTKTETKSITNNKALLLADANKGSKGVDVNEYVTTTTAKGNSTLSKRELTQVKQALLSSRTPVKSSSKKTQSKNKTGSEARTAGIRAEEGITVVFDQNKSKLYSIYNRARRKNPSLKGKIVLEITVSPGGKVTKISVVSNQINDARLESRLLKRIKQFNFGAQNVEEITITYPIEFLPS